jgi:glutamyl-Q tRNA(Asp) synthetase
MPLPVFRFAPSPNGYLHLGHALSALINFDMARAAGGRFLLRMEDIDQARCRPHYEMAICEDLSWLGVRWEEPVRRQSAHFEIYAAALARLDSLGLIYPSFESRGETARMIAERERANGAPWPRDPDGSPLYPGNARSLSTPSGPRACDRANLMRCVSTWQPPWRERGRCHSARPAAGRRGKPRRC